MNGPRWPRAARRWCVPSQSCAEPRCNGVTAAWRSATALLHASAAVRGVGSGRQLCWIAGGLAGWEKSACSAKRARCGSEATACTHRRTSKSRRSTRVLTPGSASGPCTSSTAIVGAVRVSA
jgi:hypothetical protein